MFSISQIRSNATSTVDAVKERFESIRSLDQNKLLDSDERPGHVSAAVDSWIATASFDEQGKALAFEWKSSEPNKYAECEMDAHVIENTEKIEAGEGTLKYSREYYGPTSYGIGVHSRGTIAVLDSGTEELLDAKAW